MSTQPFPLSIVFDVTVNVAPQAQAVPTFNQGLIVGNSGRIPSQGASSRCLLFLSVQAMIDYGFEENDPEVLAATLYFAQTPAPTFLWVGCQETTAIGAATVDVGGTGYAAGDFILVTQSGAVGGELRVTSVGTNGVVTGVALVPGAQGSGYSVANGLATQAATGTGLEVNITGIGETPLEAIMACRLQQPAWYLAMSTTATDADHLAIAQFAQSATPAMQYVYGTQSVTALTGATGNIFSLIKAQNLGRAHGVYSTVQGGAAPNNAFVAAAIMGVANGLNNGQANSYFTMSGQTLNGITVEPITPTQANVFGGLANGNGTGNNGNYFVNFANSYSWYQQGVNGNGGWFDQVLGLDMLAADCQVSLANYRQSLPTKTVPLTNSGQSGPINVVQACCGRSATRGFLAPGGIWNGSQILGLAPGTSLPSGFIVQSASYNDPTAYTPAQRALRQGLPIIACVILGEAQQSFTIGVNVQS